MDANQAHTTNENRRRPRRPKRRLPGRVTADAVSRRFLGRLADALDDPDLSPDQLSRLARAFAQQYHACVRARAQQIENGRYCRQRRDKYREDHPTDEELAERVRRIYGIDMDKAFPQPTSEPTDSSSLTASAGPAH